MNYDCNGKPFAVGQTTIVATRHGSRCWLETRIVIDVTPQGVPVFKAKCTGRKYVYASTREAIMIIKEPDAIT